MGDKERERERCDSVAVICAVEPTLLLCGCHLPLVGLLAHHTTLGSVLQLQLRQC